MGTPAPHALASASTSGRCACGSLTYSQEYMEAFGVALCNECKRNDSLISKGAAKDRYMLTDGELGKLGSLRKANPRHKEWQPMRLYLLSQVERLARDKWGDEDAMEASRDDRVRRRILKRQKKRQDIERQDGREAQRRRRVKERIEDDLKAHVDTFREEVREGLEGEGVRLRVYSSGVVQEVEEL